MYPAGIVDEATDKINETIDILKNDLPHNHQNPLTNAAIVAVLEGVKQLLEALREDYLS